MDRINMDHLWANHKPSTSSASDGTNRRTDAREQEEQAESEPKAHFEDKDKAYFGYYSLLSHQAQMLQVRFFPSSFRFVFVFGLSCMDWGSVQG